MGHPVCILALAVIMVLYKIIKSYSLYCFHEFTGQKINIQRPKLSSNLIESYVPKSIYQNFSIKINCCPTLNQKDLFNLKNYIPSNSNPSKILIIFLSNFTAKATYAAIAKTYSYLTPDLWKETVFTKSPYQEFTDFLAKNHRPSGTQAQKQETKQY